MAATRIFAPTSLALLLCAFVAAQDSNPAPSQSPTSSSAAHHATHHVRVEDQDSPTQSPELAKAEVAIEKQNYAAAEPLLRKLAGQDSATYVVWFDLAYVENELGNVSESIAAYRKAVAAKPDVFESNLNLGLQLAKTGQPDAEQFLRAATHLKPTSHPAEGQYRVWLAIGHTLEKSNSEEAIEAFRRAAEFQPKEAEPHISAGVLLEQEYKSSEAEQEYKRTLALDPHSSDAVIALANLYMHGRRFPEAEGYLRKLLVDHPDSAPAEIQLGRVLAAEGRNDDAIAALESGIKLAPTDESARIDLAEIYSNAGKNERAQSAYQALLLTHPNDAELHRRLGQALLRQKKFPEAQAEFGAAIKLKPDLGEAYGDLAFAAAENEQYPVVLRALDARAKLLPETSITYFLRASASDHLRDFKTAAANYRLFLKTADGKYPDYEWKAKHRLITIEPKK
jgi:tetratricopeptide (TPR) repeat protein